MSASWTQKSGTLEQSPALRRAEAEFKAVKSLVCEMIRQTKSVSVILFCASNCLKSSQAAEEISKEVLESAEIAPRIAFVIFSPQDLS